MKKKFTGMLVLASTLALAACSNNTNSETIATTKYGNVTREEFVNAMKDTVGEQTLQRLVLTKVLEGSVEDSKKLKEELPEIYDKYTKISNKKGYVKITVRADKNVVEEIKEETISNTNIDNSKKSALAALGL